MQKPAPVYALDLVLHPEHDTAYRHFEDAFANPFQPNPRNFPRVNAWWLGEAALLTYWNPVDAIPAFEAAGFQCEFIAAEGTDCYVVAQADFVVAAFRGTQPDDWKDVTADANIVLVPWRTGRVHLGFRQAFDVIRPRLDVTLARLTPGRTLWFCGHSLGAALATLAADHYVGTRGVCTLGSPRVGDPVFARAFDAKLTGRSLRYVNGNDLVTHLPLPIGYEHVGVERFIAPDGSVSSGAPVFAHVSRNLIGEPRALLEVIDGLSRGAPASPHTFLLDHMPKAYAIWMWNDYHANQ